MDIIIIIISIITISFWAYSNIWYQNRVLPYAHGYVIFGLIQWILVLINLIWIWGWIIGIIGTLAIVLGGAVIITNFTTNYLYKLLKITPTIALLVFVIGVWILGLATIIKIFI